MCYALLRKQSLLIIYVIIYFSKLILFLLLQFLYLSELQISICVQNNPITDLIFVNDPFSILPLKRSVLLFLLFKFLPLLKWSKLFRFKFH